MKTTFLVISFMFVYGYSLSQCKEITYKTPQKNSYEIGESVQFQVVNNCTKNKFILFSIEVLDTANEWQEFDGDIFVDAPMGMKIIKLLPKKTYPFTFNTIFIDSVFFQSHNKRYFRIIENLYSNDKVEIIEVKTVKEFSLINSKKHLYLRN